MKLVGIAASFGKAAAEAMVLSAPPEIDADRKDPRGEKERLMTAVQDGIKNLSLELDESKKKIEGNSAKLEMLEMHRTILNDYVFRKGIDGYIEQGYCASSSVMRAAEDQAATLENLGDSFLSERAQDIREVGRRLAYSMEGFSEPDLSHLEKNVILVAESLSPALLSVADCGRIKGILTRRGSRTSHVAILASGLGIPTVVGCAGIEKIRDGELVFLDAEKGTASFSLSEQEKERAKEIIALYEQQKADLKKYQACEAFTADRKRIRVLCNIMDTSMAEKSLKYSADGIGLFRTEFLYMDKPRLPSEAEQVAVYRSLAVNWKGKPVTIRTIDIGGDKPVESLHLEAEKNAFLGYRAIRICLDRPEIFLIQLRAILRASAFGNVQIMFPMISNISELQQAKSILEEAKKQLRAENQPFNEKIPIGMMVEIPSTAILSDKFAALVDFFSIGSNDLTQYVLAADRTNQKVASIYNHLDPGVLRLIELTIRNSREAGIPCSLCGEMAGDPLALSLLIGFGLEKFSVNPGRIPLIRNLLSLIDFKRAQTVADQALKQSSSKGVADLVNGTLSKEYRNWLQDGDDLIG
ncbi:Phosphoenolpyruvate-protein phosphotransferase [Caprobacter fermentans]|uniref:Phosphoenolpyruvate-protein phosphotransferase n=1 Tax=Caproicibacter fermentans TaxID=2576756 RepID=A0A6N8HVU4_9FIRM|nr:phosphoenolpyruvate--protein phosphotransferase [Caproicibacter fermentans]MVB09715.1 Phosphoenolpyruvate-protein phosphotransferase [Caproicibacter fermentans]